MSKSRTMQPIKRLHQYIDPIFNQMPIFTPRSRSSTYAVGTTKVNLKLTAVSNVVEGLNVAGLWGLTHSYMSQLQCRHCYFHGNELWVSYFRKGAGREIGVTKQSRALLLFLWKKDPSWCAIWCLLIPIFIVTWRIISLDSVHSSHVVNGASVLAQHGLGQN